LRAFLKVACETGNYKYFVGLLSRRFQKFIWIMIWMGTLVKNGVGISNGETRFGGSRKDAVVSAQAESRFFGAKHAPQNDKAGGESE
jgi:hypothetical protein